VTYLELISSYLRRAGADPFLIMLVDDYLKFAHPQDESPWSVEFDDIVHAAMAYANSKRFRLRRFQAALTTHQKQNPEQEARAISRALKRGNSTKETRKSMLKRLKNLEKLIGRSTKQVR
jgi:hypothetical protein